MTDYSADRAFVLTALAGLTRLQKLDPKDFDKDAALSALDEIYVAAGRVQAKGAAKACAQCNNILQTIGISARLSQALLALGSLIKLYKDGLVEIDPAFETMLNGKPADAPRTQPLGSEQARHAHASQILLPLIKFVGTQGEASALSFLTRYNAGSAAAADRNNSAQVDFDRVLQMVSTAALRAARLRSKSVSFSYSSDIDMIDAGQAHDLQAALERICETIIAFGASQETRQISMSVKSEHNGVQCKLTWYGRGLQDANYERLRCSAQVHGLIDMGATLDRTIGVSDTGMQMLSFFLARPAEPSFAPSVNTVHQSLGVHA